MKASERYTDNNHFDGHTYRNLQHLFIYIFFSFIKGQNNAWFEEIQYNEVRDGTLIDRIKQIYWSRYPTGLGGMHI